MNNIVKISGYREYACDIVKDEAEGHPYDAANAWHLVDPLDNERVFCDGLAYQDETEYKEREVKRGGVTCVNCLAKLKIIKAVKL